VRLDDFWAWAAGYVRVRVTGPAKERFVNLAAARGHRIWRARRTSRGLEINTTVGSFRRLRPIARRTRSRVRLLERHGLPFRVGRLRQRPLLVAGAVVSLMTMYLLSSMVWFVRIEGTEQLDADLLREVLGNLGLASGTLKWTLDCRALERNLLLAVNGVSWAAVEVRGVVAVVKVVEKTPLERPEVLAPPADVVAGKGGVITAIIVLAGRAVVKEGDTVRQGDVLILGRQPLSGYEPPPRKPGDPPPPPPPETEVVARGIVRARVWYEAYAEARLHSLSHQPTGRVWRQVSVHLRGLGEFPLLGWWDAPEGLYERHEKRYTFPFDLSGASVEITATTYVEVSDLRRDFSPAEAERVAFEAAAASLARQVPQDAAAGFYHYEVLRKDDIFVGVLATAETIEDIARTRQSVAEPGR